VKRLGNFVLTIKMVRVGRAFEMKAGVQSSKSSNEFRSRQNDWWHACRELVRMISVHLHDQYMRKLAI